MKLRQLILSILCFVSIDSMMYGMVSRAKSNAPKKMLGMTSREIFREVKKERLAKDKIKKDDNTGDSLPEDFSGSERLVNQQPKTVYQQFERSVTPNKFVVPQKLAVSNGIVTAESKFDSSSDDLSKSVSISVGSKSPFPISDAVRTQSTLVDSKRVSDDFGEKVSAPIGSKTVDYKADVVLKAATSVTNKNIADACIMLLKVGEVAGLITFQELLKSIQQLLQRFPISEQQLFIELINEMIHVNEILAHLVDNSQLLGMGKDNTFTWGELPKSIEDSRAVQAFWLPRRILIIQRWQKQHPGILVQGKDDPLWQQEFLSDDLWVENNVKACLYRPDWNALSSIEKTLIVKDLNSALENKPDLKFQSWLEENQIKIADACIMLLKASAVSGPVTFEQLFNKIQQLLQSLSTEEQQLLIKNVNKAIALQSRSEQVVSGLTHLEISRIEKEHKLQGGGIQVSQAAKDLWLPKRDSVIQLWAKIYSSRLVEGKDDQFWQKEFLTDDSSKAQMFKGVLYRQDWNKLSLADQDWIIKDLNSAVLNYYQEF